MDPMEGILERRSAGAVGRWEKCRFFLDDGSLQSYDPDDKERKQCRDVTNVNAMLALELDAERNEITFVVHDEQVRLRASSAEEAKKWHRALSEATKQSKPQAKAAGEAGGGASPKAKKSRKSIQGPKQQLEAQQAGGDSPKKKSIIVDGEEEIDPSSLLDKVEALLKEKQLRVVDLFRHPQFNPSYLNTRDEQLDPDEVAGVFMRAGLRVSAKACKALMRLLDDSGDNTLDMRELEAALRAHRRGKEIWDIRAEQGDGNSKKKSNLDFKRKAMTEVDEHGPTWAGPTLAALEEMMDQKDLRITDLFRHPHYNPSYLEHGDESMSAPEMQLILKKAGCELPLKDVQKMIDCIDLDGNGMVEIPEMEVALRKFRRGEMDWTEKPKKEKRPVNMEHITGLHNLHAEKLKTTEGRVEEKNNKEDEEIQQEIEDARIGTRANIEPHEWDGNACTERLYNERREQELRHVKLVQTVEGESQQKIDAARTRPVRSASDPALMERLEGFKHIGHRLHSIHGEREDNKRRTKMQLEAWMMSECDKINQDLIAKGGVVGERHHQLFEEAADRKQRRDKQRWANLEAYQMSCAEHSVGQNRQALTDFSRCHELHAENQHRIEKRAQEATKIAEGHTENLRTSAEKARCNSKTRLKNVSSRHKDMHPFQKHPVGSKIQEELQMKPTHPLGFGHRGGRHTLMAAHKSNWCIESVDHALSTVNQIVAMRANCTPEESKLLALKDLIEPLSAAMREYKDAEKESQLHGEGAEWLRNAQSMRLFHDGCLMEDQDGWHMCTQPDTLMQTIDDFDALMEQGAKAQAVLLSKVGPEAGDDNAERIGRRWPKGAKWNHPRATKKAQFAYNPGIKPRETAVAKAFVRYGPSEREGRYRHLLDLARCELVFVDGAMLRAGLEQIIEKFEVIQVLNYYHKDNQNLLGEKYIEVHIVLKCPEPFICEIRLEEMAYFIARDRVKPYMDKIQKTMVDLYSGNGADPLAISYLASWVLQRPKENHSVTIFKKHLTRRFGSTVVAWRKAMGGGNQAPFNMFRQACQDVNMRHRTVEFFQSLDATSAGNFSLFELDPEATVLLIKFYWRISGLATQEQLDDPERLFNRLASKTVVKLHRPGRMEAHEFRRVARLLGFSDLEADRVFQFLDSHGGEAHEPPATLTPSDVFWLRKMPQLVCVECVMLRDSAATSEMDGLRAITMAGRAQANSGRRARTPQEMSKRSSIRSNSVGSISGMSKPNLVVRRASSVSGSNRGSVAGTPPNGSLVGSRPHSARNSISSKQSGSSLRPQTMPVPPPTMTAPPEKRVAKGEPGNGGGSQRASVGTIGSGVISQASTAAPPVSPRPGSSSGDNAPTTAGGRTMWESDSDAASTPRPPATPAKPVGGAPPPVARQRTNSFDEDSSGDESDTF